VNVCGVDGLVLRRAIVDPGAASIRSGSNMKFTSVTDGPVGPVAPVVPPVGSGLGSPVGAPVVVGPVVSTVPPPHAPPASISASAAATIHRVLTSFLLSSVDAG
jgi:hypothetical protein